MVLAGRRAAGKNQAATELNFIPRTEKCQEFWQGHVLRRTGEVPCTGAKFLRCDVCERPGRDALRVFGDEFDDFVPVNLFGGHADSLPPAWRRGTEQKCPGHEKNAPHRPVANRVGAMPAVELVHCVRRDFRGDASPAGAGLHIHRPGIRDHVHRVLAQRKAPHDSNSFGRETRDDPRGHHLANHTNLTSIVIPEMVTDIGMEAFANCTALSRITLPGNVKSIARTRRAIPNN